MMLYPLPPPPSFAFHVVEVMSSPRYHLKRTSHTSAHHPRLTSLPCRARILGGPHGILNRHGRSRPYRQRNPQGNARYTLLDLHLPLIHGNIQDLLSPHAHLPPVALAGLSDIITPSLARDVYADVGVLLTHSRPHVRSSPQLPGQPVGRGLILGTTGAQTRSACHVQDL